jgi:hypothetical protein
MPAVKESVSRLRENACAGWMRRSTNAARCWRLPNPTVTHAGRLIVSWWRELDPLCAGLLGFYLTDKHWDFDPLRENASRLIALIARFDIPASLRDLPAGSVLYDDWHAFPASRCITTACTGTATGECCDRSDADVNLRSERSLTWVAFTPRVTVARRDDRRAAFVDTDGNMPFRDPQNEELAIDIPLVSVTSMASSLVARDLRHRRGWGRAD